MSTIVHIHAIEHGWLMVGYHSDPSIARRIIDEAEKAVESGTYYGYAVDEYRVLTGETADWNWD